MEGSSRSLRKLGQNSSKDRGEKLLTDLFPDACSAALLYSTDLLALGLYCSWWVGPSYINYQSRECRQMCPQASLMEAFFKWDLPFLDVSNWQPRSAVTQYRQEDQILDFQYTHKKPGVVTCVCNPCTGLSEAGGSLELASSLIGNKEDVSLIGELQV